MSDDPFEPINTDPEMDVLKAKHPSLFRLAEDFVLAFDRMATALEGIRVVAEKCQVKYFPDRGPVREARITRVPTEEDKLREAQGSSEAPDTTTWLGEFGEPEDIGVREREFIQARLRRQGAEGQNEQGGQG